MGAPWARSATTTLRPSRAREMASDTADRAATSGSSTATTARAAVPRTVCGTAARRYAVIRRASGLPAAASPRRPGRHRLSCTAPTLSLTGARSACVTSSRRRSRSDKIVWTTMMPMPTAKPMIRPVTP
jgi:hypothetical protein